jgi:hypothetical protein
VKDRVEECRNVEMKFVKIPLLGGIFYFIDVLFIVSNSHGWDNDGFAPAFLFSLELSVVEPHRK